MAKDWMDLYLMKLMAIAESDAILLREITLRESRFSQVSELEKLLEKSDVKAAPEVN